MSVWLWTGLAVFALLLVVFAATYWRVGSAPGPLGKAGRTGMVAVLTAVAGGFTGVGLVFRDTVWFAVPILLAGLVVLGLVGVALLPAATGSAKVSRRRTSEPPARPPGTSRGRR